MILLLAVLAVQADYIGPSRDSLTMAETKQVIDDSETICPELGRHDAAWDPVPYLRQSAAVRSYTLEQQRLLVGLCTLYTEGWTAALADHEVRRERRRQR